MPEKSDKKLTKDDLGDADDEAFLNNNIGLDVHEDYGYSDDEETHVRGEDVVDAEEIPGISNPINGRIRKPQTPITDSHQIHLGVLRGDGRAFMENERGSDADVDEDEDDREIGQREERPYFMPPLLPINEELKQEGDESDQDELQEVLAEPEIIIAPINPIKIKQTSMDSTSNQFVLKKKPVWLPKSINPYSTAPNPDGMLPGQASMDARVFFVSGFVMFVSGVILAAILAISVTFLANTVRIVYERWCGSSSVKFDIDDNTGIDTII